MARASCLVHQAFPAMGSPCELQFWARDQEAAEAALGAARAEVLRLESRYSRYRDDSIVAHINRVAASGGSLSVDGETAGLLHYADTCWRESDGLFDITSGVLRQAWDFKSGRLPPGERVEALLERVGWQRLRWSNPVLSFPRAGLELDLGGVVKEYAADRIAALARDMGVEGGMINLGGDIRILGPRPDGGAWRIGIRHPRQAHGLWRTQAMADGGLASSGDYERCLVVDGVRYGHILNPRTGWPVRHLASVSVAAPHCLVAGSAATIALLMEANGPAWLADLGLPHCWMDVSGREGGNLGQG